jgi:hypothetical protein
MAVAGEDRDAVAILMLARQASAVLEIVGADDLQHGAENLFLVALHVGLTWSNRLGPMKKPFSCPCSWKPRPSTTSSAPSSTPVWIQFSTRCLCAAFTTGP